MSDDDKEWTFEPDAGWTMLNGSFEWQQFLHEPLTFFLDGVEQVRPYPEPDHVVGGE